MAEHYYNHRVRLVSVKDESLKVEFKVTPTFTEGRTVEYTAVTPIHMPGSIQVYKNTASRTFNIGAMFVSRSVNEANENMTLLQTLRTWTLPYFGASNTLTSKNLEKRQERARNAGNPAGVGPQSTTLTPDEKAALVRARVNAQGVEGVQLLGAPPMVLYLYAYSTSLNDKRGSDPFPRVNINRVPVVITSLSFSYPNDVDYFPGSFGGIGGITTSTEGFPTKMEATIDCVETHSPREYERFSLQAFYDGTLVNF